MPNIMNTKKAISEMEEMIRDTLVKKECGKEWQVREILEGLDRVEGIRQLANECGNEAEIRDQVYGRQVREGRRNGRTAEKKIQAMCSLSAALTVIADVLGCPDALKAQPDLFGGESS